eukprot:TRINITY_DN47870_c0_g1_i4.p2 TRINITY_DN47870_c0_g1~~TRINITY_DN47870_c0_g1_i4.p2  ORF type:complete len:127 (+),score=31.92 TRINITY_DN47870_c0_g1_i4:190-570(+)
MNADGYYEFGYTFSPDWWSVGIIACELFCGKPPFGYKDGEVLEGRSIQSLAAESPHSIDWSRLTEVASQPSCRAFVDQLLSADPEQRLGWTGGGEEVRRHQLFDGLDESSAPPLLVTCEAIAESNP